MSFAFPKKRLDLSDPKIKTPEQAAKMVYDHLCYFCFGCGLSPAYELSLRAPAETKLRIDSECWWVTFDAGGHDWAVDASLNQEPNDTNHGIFKTHGSWGFCETYYGIDLMFWEG